MLSEVTPTCPHDESQPRPHYRVTVLYTHGHRPDHTHASTGTHATQARESVEPALLPFGCSLPVTTLLHQSAFAAKQF